MEYIKSHLLQKRNLVPIVTVSLFFCIYILLGISIIRDYGVSLDEGRDYTRGRLAYARMMGGSEANFVKACSRLGSSCWYPSFFSIVSYAIAPSGTERSIILRKHALTFAFFVFSVFVFFLLGRKIFKNWKIGLLGALFLIISPRIFAHSFFNPKDIPFLSAYVIATYTLLLFLEKKNFLTALLHGLAVGMTCAIRTPGVILLPITAFFYFFDLFLAKQKPKIYLKALFFLLACAILTAGMVYIFSPALYGNPIGGYIESINIMKQFPWNNYHLYMGQNITNKIPWHYTLVWFSISSPLMYVVLFLGGLGILAIRTIRARHIEQFQSMRDLYVVASLGILPILAIIVMKSVIYTTNRQMYFVYPALLLLSLLGFIKLMDKLRDWTQRWQIWAALILIVGLASPVYFMVRSHPYQLIYFNFLAGPSLSVIKERFPLDPWALSGKEALEYILKTDPSEYIYIYNFDTKPVSFLILPYPQMQRIRFVTLSPSEQPPNYIVTNYRDYPAEQATQAQGLPPMKEYYTVKVDGVDIFTVYKVIGK